MDCAIWNVELDIIPSSDGNFHFNSPHAGGLYSITPIAYRDAKFQRDERKLITSWLCEQRRLGVKVPGLDTENIPRILQRRPLPFSQRVDNLLRLFATESTYIGQYLDVRADQARPFIVRAAAETESYDPKEAYLLMWLMKDMHLIEGMTSTVGAGDHGKARLTANGWERVEAINKLASSTSQAFVAMWFNPATTAAYDLAIHPAITELGYQPMRIDKKEHANKIDDEIIAEIRRSRFLVADFTCEPEKVRGGVYFEAGFAQGLGLPVIWCCNEDSNRDLHFDTRQYNHIMWNEPEDLYAKLKVRIGAVVGDGPFPKPRH